ncbi:MAG: chromate transporter [Lachnospiraceae bacterium]|nr:chromate transporter [Lachnospiraceae bacterium]
MKDLFELVKQMFKIGCIGFGGGSALIPVLERETVTKKDVISKSEFDKNVVVASITPGALPVEIASGIGLSAASYLGMVLSAVAMALPGVVITILLLSLFTGVETQALNIINYVAVPVSVYIIYMLLLYIKKAVYIGDKDISVRDKTLYILTVLIVFALNAGKEIEALTGSDVLMFFDLSSIQILGMAFFVIIFNGSGIKLWKSILTVILCASYAVCVGKNNIDYPAVENGLKTFMILFGTGSLYVTFKEDSSSWDVDWNGLWRCLAVWIGVLFVLLLPALLMVDDIWPFVGRGLLSSFMSFGGGDAYLSMADGVFVQSGMVSEAIFYGQLVVIVNVLPGSILCKTLSGIGYLIGYGISGNVMVGIAMAIGGFGISIFGSCAISITCLHLYSGLQKLRVFNIVGRWIRPIVGGTLLSICLSLIVGIVSNF